MEEVTLEVGFEGRVGFWQWSRKPIYQEDFGKTGGRKMVESS